MHCYFWSYIRFLLLIPLFRKNMKVILIILVVLTISNTPTCCRGSNLENPKEFFKILKPFFNGRSNKLNQNYERKSWEENRRDLGNGDFLLPNFDNLSISNSQVNRSKLLFPHPRQPQIENQTETFPRKKESQKKGIKTVPRIKQIAKSGGPA